ncbi:MAG: hypothetical protein A3C35_03030 [Omnitrophica bacterium RIFCSPHIGHO2_02_FULL_46_11]|nr:MAG: hypothetical protein A3C35_03030 [Omnitrophica bacterium RIFCSPHIGHO2_02_FULL_46_11]OGW84890.1 MAG: hypothetical protein A3A81_01060 [Omnitrophica bacterium RIFCSPLOWO2_01_FULL_45_10b]
MDEIHMITVQVQLMKEGDTVIVNCPSLDLCGYGKTADEAKKDFDVAFKIFAKETTGHGTFEQALEELGWKKIQVRNRPRWKAGIELLGEVEKVQLSVPV